MTTIFCLDCDWKLEFDPEPKLGQRVICPSCNVELEVINLNPPELDWTYDGPVLNRAWTDSFFSEGWLFAAPVVEWP